MKFKAPNGKVYTFPDEIDGEPITQDIANAYFEKNGIGQDRTPDSDIQLGDPVPASYAGDSTYHADGSFTKNQLAQPYQGAPATNEDVIKATPQTLLGGAQGSVAGAMAFTNALAPTPWQDELEKIFRGMQESGQANVDEAMPKGLEPDSFREGYMSAMQSAGAMAPAALTAPLGGLAAFSTGIFLTSAGRGYDQALRAGLPKSTSLLVGALKGGIEAGTERIPLGILFKGVPKKGIQALAKQALAFMVAEAGQEVAAETLEAAVDKMYIDKDMTFDDYLKNLKSLMKTLPFSVPATYGMSKAVSSTYQQANKYQQQKMNEDSMPEEVEARYNEEGEIEIAPKDALDQSVEDSDGGRGPEFIEENALGGEKNTVPQTNEEHLLDVLNKVDAAKKNLTPGEKHVKRGKEGFPTENNTKVKRNVAYGQVFKKHLKALGIQIDEKKTSHKRILGTYQRVLKDKKTKKVINKEFNNITIDTRSPRDPMTLAHELGHYFQRVIFKDNVNALWKDNVEVTNELKELGYEKGNPAEGFADFFARWLSEDAAVDAEDQRLSNVAPNTLAWWENLINDKQHVTSKKKPIKPLLMDMKKDITNFYAQGALFRAQSKFGTEKEWNSSFRKWTSQFRQDYFDKFEAFRRIEKWANSGILKVGGLYETIRMIPGASNVASASIFYGALKVDPKTGETRVAEGDEKGAKSLYNIIKGVRRAGGSVADFGRYAAGKSSQELQKQGRQNRFSQDELDALTDLEKAHPEYKKAFDEYQEWVDANLDYAEALGYVSPEDRATWRREWYFPMYTVKTKPGKASGDSRSIIQTQATKRLFGSTENLGDPIENMVSHANHMVGQAYTNEKKRSAIKAILKMPNAGSLITPLSPTSTPAKIKTEQIQRMALEMMGLPTTVDQDLLDRLLDTPEKAASYEQIVRYLKKKDENGYLTLWQHGQTPHENNVVGIIDKGKVKYYRVIDEQLYESFKAMQPHQRHQLFQMAAWVKKIGQTTVTLTPDFIMRNLARDTLHAWGFSRNGFIPIIDTARGLVSAFTHDQDYKDFIANGGGMSSYMIQPGMLSKEANQIHRAGNWTDHAAQKLTRGPIDLALKVSDATEMATRLGEYKKARARGKTKQQAAYDAREVSTDFAQSGANQSYGDYQSTIMFLKAAQAGLDRAYRGFTDKTDNVNTMGISDRGAIMSRTAALMAASVALAARWWDDEDYNSMQDWEKNGYWHLGKRADGGWIRYPKIWEIGAFSSLAERSVELAWKTFKDEHKMSVEDAFIFRDIIIDQFKIEVLPQVVKPAFEVWTNKNRFTKRPILKKDQIGQKWDTQFDASTPEVLVQLGKKYGFSPKVVEHMLRGHFNTWAYYGLFLTDSAFWEEGRASRHIGEYPIMKTFYPPPVARNTKYMQDFYDFAGEVGKMNNAVKTFKNQYRPEWAQELYEDTSKLINAQTFTNKVKKINTDTNKKIQQLNHDLTDRYTPAEKRGMIDKLNQDRNNAMKKAMQEIRSEFPDWHPSQKDSWLDLVNPISE